MNTSKNKTATLREAIAEFVIPGSHISIGGFTINRNPMAAVYEIIRQGIKGLHLYAHSNGQGADELIGGGCVKRLEIAYGGNGRFAPTCIRFRKAVQNGNIRVEDYTNYQMTLRFLAGAMGVPFLPTRSSLGTDIIKEWGFPAEIRLNDPRLPDSKLIVIDNPFGGWQESPRTVLVPAINPDVTIIHAQKCDRQGTTRIQGLTFSDIEQARSARNVIVTCEELVDPDELRGSPDQNQIPFFCVDAVVHIPYGAYPTACYGYYDYDPVYLHEYAGYAGDDASFRDYLDLYVFGVSDHHGLLDMVGEDRLRGIDADSDTGYAKGLERK